MKLNIILLSLLSALIFLCGLGLGHWQKGFKKYEVAPPTLPDPEQYALISFGSILFNSTQSNLGPAAMLAENRYTKAGLNCSSCHINGGINPFSLNLLGVSSNYPKTNPKTGEVQTLADRVNQCMERSMNGKPLPAGSRPLNAFVAYLNTLKPISDQASLFHKGDELEAHQGERAGFYEIATGGDPQPGRVVFEQNCTACHGKSGQGVLSEKGDRYIYAVPPLWGPRSFNRLAGMNSPRTFTRFVYDYMPMDNPSLTVEQAHDVAAFILSQQRP